MSRLICNSPSGWCQLSAPCEHRCINEPEPRKVTADEDRWLRNAAMRSATVVHPCKLKDDAGVSVLSSETFSREPLITGKKP